MHRAEENEVDGDTWQVCAKHKTKRQKKRQTTPLRLSQIWEGNHKNCRVKSNWEEDESSDGHLANGRSLLFKEHSSRELAGSVLTTIRN